jgi:hypothetical protein
MADRATGLQFLMESPAYKFFRGVAKLHYSAWIQFATLSPATAFELEKRHEFGRWPCPQARSAVLPLP